MSSLTLLIMGLTDKRREQALCIEHAPQTRPVCANEVAMRLIAIALACVITSVASAKESCDKAVLGLTDNDSQIRQYFYTGTCHYRNEDYKLAVENWIELSELEPATSDDEALKVSVLNNLGYMKYFGLGVKQNQLEAIEFWKRAVLLGHAEAEYHLCHAYADIKQATYNKENAKSHCNRALQIYRRMEKKDDEILKDIERYIELIRGI